MRAVVASIEGEFRRYKALAEGAFGQLGDADLTRAPSTSDLSVAAIAWHVSGNLTSRFTDFLTSDGEKPWRDRESEFQPRSVGRDALTEKWEAGWRALFDATGALSDTDLSRAVTIRGQQLTVLEALHRSLAHASYHIGQIVYQAKSLRGSAWSHLSIPPGQSDAYNRSPGREKPPPR